MAGRLGRRLGKLLRPLLLVPIVGAVFFSTASASHVAPTVRDVNMANLGTNERELSIAVDPGNPDHLAAGANERNVPGGTQRWYTSTNGGRTWTNGRLPQGTLTVAGTSSTTMSDPSLDFGSAGQIYYSALMHGGDPDPCTLFVSVSTNDGANWTDPASGIVATGTTGPTVCQDKEHIAVDRAHSDNVYVAWTPIGGALNQQVQFSRDLNGVANGLAFSAPTQLSTAAGNVGCLNQGADFALAGNTMYVAWTSFCSGFADNDPGTVWVTKSTNQGGSWSAPVAAATLNNVDFTAAGFRSRSHPSTDIDPVTGRVFVVYATYAGGGTNADVNIVSSPDGTSWTSPTRVNQNAGTSDQWMPWIDVANGRITVAYFSREDGASTIDLHMAYAAVAAPPSFTSIRVSSASTPTSTGFLGDYNGNFTGSDDVVHPAWGDGRAGNGGATDAYTARVNFSPPELVTISPASSLPQVGTTAILTAHVTGAHGENESFIPVTFSVTSSGSPSGLTGVSGSTPSSGLRTFSYTNTVTGSDTVHAFADLDEDGVADPGETVDATVSWQPGPPTSIAVAPAAATHTVGDLHTATATLRDQYNNRVPGFLVRFSEARGAPSPASGSGLTNGSGEFSFAYTNTVSGVDTLHAFSDFNGNLSEDLTETVDTTVTWLPGPPASLTLTPNPATNIVDATHTLTADVRDQFGNAVLPVTVRFSVAGANGTFGLPTSGSGPTVGGLASFPYVGPMPGPDTITAFADFDGNGVRNPAPSAHEPQDTAAKTWVLPASTLDSKVKGEGEIPLPGGAKAKLDFDVHVHKDGKLTGDFKYDDKGTPGRKVKDISITAVVVTGSTATIFGTAKVDGAGSFVFRIDAADNGPGPTDTFRLRMSDGYDSGTATLTKGKIKIK